MQIFDLFVIGGGSGGSACARASAALGAKVGLAEGSDLGGTCVNRGCVPKKFYSYAANYHKEIIAAQAYGWQIDKKGFDWQILKTKVFEEVKRLNGIYENLLKEVAIFNNYAKIIAPGLVQVGEQQIATDKILIATGGYPFIPDIPGAEYGITSDQAFHLERLPRKIAIIGGGYIAVEFASIFNSLGVEVDLIMRSKILGAFDNEISEIMEDELSQLGINICNKTKITKLVKQGARLISYSENGEETASEQVMFAMGRVPNLQNLGAEEIGIALNDKGAIIVNKHYKTSLAGIYAIGDVIDRVNLTPVAVQVGRAFADMHFGSTPRDINWQNIPSAVFSAPPIATVGLTE